MMVHSASSGGGAALRGSVGVRMQMQGFRRVVIALLVVLTTAIAHVHCTPALPPHGPTQQRRTSVSFNQDEADALNGLFENWTALGLNQELITILNWTATASSLHPCNVSDKFKNLRFGTYGTYEGAWSGLGCTSRFDRSTFRYEVSVTRLQLVGSNAGCNSGNGYHYKQCGFNGIEGVLPSAISKLVNLQYLFIHHNPELTGPVPFEIWQMPKLLYLSLRNNSLVGNPSFYNSSSKLYDIDLSNNNFSGNLQVSPGGYLFSWSL